MVVAKKFNVGLITSNNLFQMFWGLSLCCFVAYCKQAASWHWHSNGFLPVTRPCSPFFFLCLFVEHLETAGPLFFSRVLYVSWSYLWVFLCIPNNYPGSCGWNFCPYFLNGVWSVLNGILNSLDIFLYPFPVLQSSTTFSSRSFDNSFAFPVVRNPATSVQHWMKHAEVCQKPRNSLFIHTHWLQANRSQVRTVTFRRHLNPCVYVIRPKPPGYLNRIRIIG